MRSEVRKRLDNFSSSIHGATPELNRVLEWIEQNNVRVKIWEDDKQHAGYINTGPGGLSILKDKPGQFGGRIPSGITKIELMNGELLYPKRED